MKEKASQTRVVKPRTIISEEMGNCNEDVMAILPTQAGMSQVINRVRAKNRSVALPATFEDVQFPPEIATYEGENFVIYDSRQDVECPRHSKILLFASGHGLSYLSGKKIRVLLNLHANRFFIVSANQPIGFS